MKRCNPNLLLLLLPLAASAFWFSFSPKHNELYALLQVDSHATSKQIKTSFRKLALHYHPDRHPRASTAASSSSSSLEYQRTFEQISRAKEILTDVEARDIYDRLGEDGLRRWRDDNDPSVHADYVAPVNNDPIIDRIIQFIFQTAFGEVNYNDL